MSQKIYRAQIRTQNGRAVLNIFDQSPNNDTPSLFNGDIYGGIKLEQGDTGSAQEDIPNILGSFFDVRLEDTKTRDFSRIFSQPFNETKYRVILELPENRRWEGYIRQDITSRNIEQVQTRKDRIQITCYDGLGALKDVDGLGETYDVGLLDMFSGIFQFANPNLPIHLKLDVDAYDPPGDLVPINKINAIEGNATQFSPLEGERGEKENPITGTAREQLEELSRGLFLTGYQDIDEKAWVIVDIGRVGEGLNTEYYNGNDWVTNSLPEKVFTSDVITDESEDKLKTLPSIKSVTYGFGNLTIDPEMAQMAGVNNPGNLFHWEHPNTSVAYGAGTVGDPKDADFGETNMDWFDDNDYFKQVIEVNIDTYNITEIEVEIRAETDGEGSNVIIDTTLEYTDGTSQNNNTTPSQNGRFWRQRTVVDQGKTIERITLRVDKNASNTNDSFIQACRVRGLQQFTEIAPDGTTLDRLRIVDNIRFFTSDVGRKDVEDGRVGFIVEVASKNDRKATAEYWESERFGQQFNRIIQWRAKTLITLRPPELDKLETKIPNEVVPLGTRIRVKKPESNFYSDFVHLNGRVLHFGTNEMDYGTRVKDMELPATFS